MLRSQLLLDTSIDSNIECVRNVTCLTVKNVRCWWLKIIPAGYVLVTTRSLIKIIGLVFGHIFWLKLPALLDNPCWKPRCAEVANLIQCLVSISEDETTKHWWLFFEPLSFPLPWPKLMSILKKSWGNPFGKWSSFMLGFHIYLSETWRVAKTKNRSS